MDFLTAVQTCLKKYVTFSGRATRSEFWWFFLFTVILKIAAIPIDKTFFPVVWGIEDFEPVGVFVDLATLLPVLAAMSRRLHDTGRSAWWIVLPYGVGFTSVIFYYLIGGMITLLITLIIILVIVIIMITWLAQKGSMNPNQYGHNPYRS